jgi:glycosyltransferase involved in cell wall biosynthesis
MKKKMGIIGTISCIHLQRYVNTLDRSTYDITIITWDSNYLVDSADKVFFVDAKQFNFLKTIRRLWAYFYFIKSSNFDVLHCFSALLPVSWLAGIACTSALTVSVIGVDVFLEEQMQMNYPIKKSIVHLLRMADRVFFLSQAMRDRLIRSIGVAEAILREDFLPVDKKWQCYPVKKSITSRFIGYPIIFSPRMLAPLYRQYELIQALAKLKIKYPNVNLVQTGYYADLAYKEKCQKLSMDLGVDNNITFMEHIETEEALIDVYDQADIVVMIPLSDGMPSSLLEAWWRKKPVIVSDIYNYNELWNGKFFIKTPITDEALSNCIASVFWSKNIKTYLTTSAFDFIAERSKAINVRFEDIKIKRKFFSKIYGTFLFFIFLIEPHFSRFFKLA